MIDNVKKYKSTMVGLLFVATLCACHAKSVSAPTSAAVDSSQQSSKIVTMKDAKPGAPVALVSAPLVDAQANQVLQTSVILRVGSVGKIKIHFNPDPGLQLVNAEELPQIFEADGINPITIPVSILVTQDGRYHLNLQVQFMSDNAVSARVMGLIVQAGSVGLPAAQIQQKTQQKNSTGENLEVLPAQESIRAK